MQALLRSNLPGIAGRVKRWPLPPKTKGSRKKQRFPFLFENTGNAMPDKTAKTDGLLKHAVLGYTATE